jgi:hypothetical protein
MVRGVASPPAKSGGRRPTRDAPSVIKAMSEKEKKKDKAREKERPAVRSTGREIQIAVQRPVSNAAQEAVATAREEQAREELEGVRWGGERLSGVLCLSN